ncbi:MAG: polysaccharide deacetylase family protein [Betaproteobacteria bacterium]
MLKTHGRYDYSPIVQRKAYAWPNGARLAVFIAVNVEQFPFGEGLGPELNPRQPEPDVLNFGWRDWGNRVGVWRLLELFDETRMPAAALLNTAIYEHCPDVAAGFRKRGDEIVGHGRTNAERQAEMPEEAERSMLSEVTKRIQREEGAAPQGWLGPWVSETRVTPDLLAELGYRYVLDWMVDDQPIWLRTRSGKRLLAIPYARPTSDMPMLHGAKLTPAAWADVLVDQIDEMLLQAERQPLVFNLSLHPYLMHAFRLRHLRRVLLHLNSRKEKVWLARPRGIAAHVAALPEGVVP